MWVSTEICVLDLTGEFLGMVGLPAPISSESKYAV